MSDFKTISTRIPSEYNDIFCKICEQRGISPSMAIRWMVNIFVRYTDGTHNLDGKLQKAIGVFEDADYWTGPNNILLSESVSVDKAVYVLKNKRGERKGSALIVKGRNGEKQASYNSREILEMIAESAFPSTYRRLRRIGVELGTTCAIETIRELIDIYGRSDGRENIATLFDEYQSGNGDDVAPYRRKHTESMSK